MLLFICLFAYFHSYLFACCCLNTDFDVYRFVVFHVKILLDSNRKPHVIDVDCDPGFQTLGSETFRAR